VFRAEGSFGPASRQAAPLGRETAIATLALTPRCLMVLQRALRGLRRTLPRSAMIAILWPLASMPPVLGDERPSPVAPYRYLVPGETQANSVRQQQGYSYRNELARERLRLERGLSGADDAASRLRRQGEINRELDRVDRLLNR
jgi:hypothetical protein